MPGTQCDRPSWPEGRSRRGRGRESICAMQMKYGNTLTGGRLARLESLKPGEKGKSTNNIK